MKPDAIYLLTDGQFSDPTEKFLEEKNKRKEEFTEKLVPKSVVHTIGFFSQDGQELLQRLAKENGGTYRFVPPPPGLQKGPRQPKNPAPPFGPGKAKRP